MRPPVFEAESGTETACSLAVHRKKTGRKNQVDKKPARTLQLAAVSGRSWPGHPDRREPRQAETNTI